MMPYVETEGPASMGPRSGERGNLHPFNIPRRRPPASMGPRSGERGNQDAVYTNCDFS